MPPWHPRHKAAASAAPVGELWAYGAQPLGSPPPLARSMGTSRVIIGFTSDCGGCGAASLQWSFLRTPSCRRTAVHTAICRHPSRVLAPKLWLTTPAQRGQPPFTMPLRRQGSDANSVMSGMTNVTGVDRRLPVREQLRAPINLASLSGCAHVPVLE